MKRLLLAALLTLSLTAPAFAQSEKLTVLLDWFVNPDHAPLVVAKQAGFFEKAGLDVTLVPPADPSAPPRLVAAGQGDIALSYQPSLYLHVKEGLPLTRIGTAIATPLSCLVVKADGPIRTLADLKGKTVGFSVGGFEDALLGTMLKSVGLGLKDVTTININFALTQSLLGGKVDAVIGAFRNFELTQIALAGGKGRAFFPEEHGVPAYDELIYIAHSDKLKDPRLPKFLAALEAAQVFILNHPDEAWKAFTAAYPKLDDKLNRQAWLDTMARFQQVVGALDAGRYARFGAFMKAQGLIDKVEETGRYAVTLP